ncbi:MAG: nucleotidyltransferase family protein [Acidobacteriota bacterium]|nr:nucleotidyltransferase family protein [Acidobacteriota bacterium]
MTDVAAIILAAGRSRRMGAFKPLLPFGDSTVILHCIQNLRRAGVETIIVVVGHRAEDLQLHLHNACVTFAVNPDSSSEMCTSIAFGTRALPASTKAVVVTPVDHAAVPADIVSKLIRCWQKGAPLVVPTWHGRGGHPVVIDYRFREEMLSLDSTRGLRALFDAHPAEVTRLPVDSPYIARDMDTWDDYAALHEDVFGVSPIKPRVPLKE